MPNSSDAFAASSPYVGKIGRRCVVRCALLSVAAVVLVVFLLPANVILSGPDTDMMGQFVAWRAFAVDSIHAGDFPCWNPYCYSGQPFLGDFMSGELYPPNVIFLFLPLARAMNLSYLVHLLILGWGMGYWAHRRGYHPVACGLTGLILVLSGPVFLRLYSGHIPFVCTMAWMPWMFAALEAAWRGPAARPLLLASACIGLQILGGGEQYFFYTAIAAGMQAVVYSVFDSTVRRRAGPQLMIAYLGALPLAAFLLLPGLSAVSESVRQGKMDFDFVSIMPFAPENLLSLLAPGFFGHLADQSYWGRGYMWEMSLFVSVTGVALAVLALGDREHRRLVWADAIIMLPLFVLALGSQTPVLHFLYDYVPGFGSFRSLAKFIFPMALFGVLIIGAGIDAVVRQRLGAKILTMGVLAMGILATGAGLYIRAEPASLDALVQFIHETHKSIALEGRFDDMQYIRDCSVKAGVSLAWGGGILLGTAVCLLLARRWPGWRWVPLAVLPLEMLSFGQANLGTMSIETMVPKEVSECLLAHPGDYRVMDAVLPNNGYFTGKADIWGNDPMVLKRYAEFIAFTQGDNPDRVNQEQIFHQLTPAFALLRFRFAFIMSDNELKTYERPDALPHALLVQDYQVSANRDAIFAELARPEFDPQRAVLLEQEPSPRPQPDAPPGTVRLVARSSDSLVIVADVPAPCLLLITDLYSRDWRVRPLAGSEQTHYDILPGDYILRAIPLAAGHHHLVVEYNPSLFQAGLIISALAWVVWLGLMIKMKPGREYPPVA